MGLRLSFIWRLALIHFWLFLSLSWVWAEEPLTFKPTTYTNQQLLSEMLVVAATEQILDKAPALAVTFSQDLDTNLDPAAFFTITQDGRVVEGRWEVVNNPRRLYFTQIQANTNYRIQIRPGVTAKNGLKLLKPLNFELKTREIQPAFDFASKGNLIPLQVSNGLPIRVVNVPELDVEFLRVQPEKLGEVFKAIRLDDSLQSWELDEIHHLTSSVYTTRYPTGAKPNAYETFVLPVNQIEVLKQPGLYFAVIRQPGRFTDRAYRITHFVVTNIGLQARVYAKNLEVFAHALDSGKPLRGIKITAKDNQTATELVTDENGHASFTERPTQDFFITANSEDNQFAFLDLRSPPLDLSNFPIQGLAEKAIDLYVYASHALYRPGDTLKLNILQRDRDGLVTNSPLKLSLVRPDTKVIWEETLQPFESALGYYQQSFTFDNDAPEGTWRAELRLGEDAQVTAVFEFQVQAYQAEYRRLVLSSGKTLLTRDDKQLVSVQGNSVQGKLAAQQKVTAARDLQIDTQPLGKAFQAYVFGVPEDLNRLASVKLPQTNLDEQGNGFLEFPAIDPAIQTPLKTTIIANLLELGGQPVTNELQQTYWPAQHLVGVKPLFTNATVPANSEANFELVRVDPAGNLIAAQHLTATLFSESYDYYWEYDQDKGWQKSGVRNQYPVLQQQVELAAGQKGYLSLAVSTGQYRLEVEDADTKLKTAYVFAAGRPASSNFKDQANSLDLQLDQSVYKAGEVAKLTAQLPAKSEVLVTVEGGKLLWNKQMSLPAGQAVIEIPIDEAWQQHDLYLSVQALQTIDSGQQTKLERQFGILPLALDRSERQLALSLEVPDLVMAEQPLKIKIKAENLKSQEALVTLSAVDTQVLKQVPLVKLNPFNFYFSAHAYDARLYDTYNQILEKDETFSLMPQADSKRISPQTWMTNTHLGRSLVALESEPVKFDAEGKAEISLNLPAFTGDLHLTATAFGVEQLGYTSKTIQVGAPVQFKVTAPEFLGAGDQVFLKMDLKNLDEIDQLVHLKVSSNSLLSGVTFEKALTLTKAQLESIELPITSLSSLGLGKIQVELVGKDFKFKRDLNILIRPSYMPKVDYQQQELLGSGKTFDLNLPTQSDSLADSAVTCLSISNTPSLPVAAVLRSLLKYPYHSLEQTVSSAYPYLFLDEVATRKWDLPVLSLDQRTEFIQKALRRLQSRQLPNGGFSLWAKLGPEEYWLDAYATSFLLDARQQGFAVSKALLDSALANLQQTWQKETAQLEERYPLAENAVQMDLAVRAYSAYVLARARKLTLNELKSFADKAAPQMELGLSLVNLGLALSLQGDAPRGDEYIQRGLGTSRSSDIYLGDYGSVLRDRTMLLYHLLLAKQTVPALSVHIDYILRDLQAYKYLSTQEQVYLFLLGNLLDQQAKAPWQAQLVVEGQKVDLAQTGSFSRCIQQFKPNSQVITQNDEAIYLNLMTQAYPQQRSAASEKPVRVQRKWYALSGEELNPKDLKLGDLVLTRLNIDSTEPIPHALVVDLLPSGFTLEGADLQANEALQGLKLDDMAVSVAETMAYSSVVQESFWPDRYVANLALKAKANRNLFYLVRVANSARATIPQAYVIDLDRPFVQGLSSNEGVLQLQPE